MQKIGDCPLEKLVHDSLKSAEISFFTDFEGKVPENLDFYLPDIKVHIEIKGGHSDRIAKQMKKSKNIIVAQGKTAVEFLAKLISQNK